MALLLSLILLSASGLSRLKERELREGSAAVAEEAPPAAVDAKVHESTERSPTVGVSGTREMRQAFASARRARVRSSRSAGAATVEVESWGEPEELMLSLYSAAAAARLLRFRLLREPKGEYRLFVEARDE